MSGVAAAKRRTLIKKPSKSHIIISSKHLWYLWCPGANYLVNKTSVCHAKPLTVTSLSYKSTSHRRCPFLEISRIRVLFLWYARHYYYHRLTVVNDVGLHKLRPTFCYILPARRYMLARGTSYGPVSVCLSICHKSEFSRNGWTNRDGSFLTPVLHCVKRIFAYLQIILNAII